MKEGKYFGKMKKQLEPSFTICAFLIIFFIPQISHSESLDNVIKGLQSYLNNTDDFAASFIQVTQLQSFDEKQITRGEVYIMKPGKMRWEYQKPEPQTIVINNRHVWIYTPEENQVLKARVESLGTSAIYELFISNEIKINEMFNISAVKEKETSEKPKLFLELFPKNIDVNINKVIIELTKTDYQIKSFVTYDKLDNITTIKFTNVRRNKGLKPSIFNFKIPEGVELLTPEDLGGS